MVMSDMSVPNATCVFLFHCYGFCYRHAILALCSMWWWKLFTLNLCWDLWALLLFLFICLRPSA